MLIVSCGRRLAHQHEADPQIRKYAARTGLAFQVTARIRYLACYYAVRTRLKLYRQGLSVRYRMTRHIKRAGLRKASSAISYEPTLSNIREPQCFDPSLLFPLHASERANPVSSITRRREVPTVS